MGPKGDVAEDEAEEGGGDRCTDDIWMNQWKDSLCVLQGLVPFGAAAQRGTL